MGLLLSFEYVCCCLYVPNKQYIMIKYSTEFTKSVLIAPKSIDHLNCCYRFCSCFPIGPITYNSIFFLLFFSVVYFGVNCILHCVFSMKIEFITSFTDRIGCCINGLKYSSVNKIKLPWISIHTVVAGRTIACTMCIIMYSRWMHACVCVCVRLCDGFFL